MRNLLVVVACTVALCAQDQASPFRFVPKDAFLVARCSGPAAWQQQFARSQVLKLILGDSAAPLRKVFTAGWDEAMGGLRQSGKVDADLLDRTLRGYTGEAVLAVDCDFTALAQAMQDEELPPFTVVFSCAPDGHTDFAPLLEQMVKAAEEEVGDRLTDLAVGDLRLRCSRPENGGCTLPFLHQGHLLVIASQDLQTVVPKILSAEGTGYAAPAEAAGALWMHIDGTTMVGTLISAIAAQVSESGAPFDVEQIMADLGLGSLRAFSFALGAEGAHVTGDMALEFNDQERGLFGIMPASAKRPRLLDVLPSSCDQFSVTAFDLGAVWRTVEKVWGSLEPVVPMSLDSAMAAFAEACKVRLREDLLAHFGTELMMLQDVGEIASAAASADPDDATAAMSTAFAGSCLALSLRDGKAFGESLEKLIRSRGLHVSRKSEDYAGLKLHKLRLLGAIEIEYAIGDDLLVLGSGSGGQHLRAVLDERSARAAGKPLAELPAGVKSRLSTMPDDWMGLSVTSVSGVMDAMLSAFTSAAENAGADLEELHLDVIMQTMRSLRGEMQQLGIDTMVSTTYTSARGWRSLLRW